METPRIATWIGVLAGVAAAVGGLGALVWWRGTPLPTYHIEVDSSAVMAEGGQQLIVAADALFAVIGLFAGLLLGALAWSWFKWVGWPAAIIATCAGLGAGLVCWGVGQLLGPGPFDQRLAAARPGDVVPISLQLHAPSALAVWAFAAVAPTLFASSLGPEVDKRRGPAPAVPGSMADHGGTEPVRSSDRSTPRPSD